MDALPSPKPYAKTEQVITTIRLGERQQLDRYAAQLEVSRATLIRRYITEGLERDKRRWKGSTRLE